MNEAEVKECRVWSTVKVSCPHDNMEKTREVPISCGDFYRCDFCRLKRKKKVRRRIARGFNQGTQAYFLTLTLAGKRSGDVPEILRKWDTLRRELDRVFNAVYKPDNISSRKSGSPIRSPLGAPKPFTAMERYKIQRAITTSPSKAQWRWFRVVEKAKPIFKKQSKSMSNPSGMVQVNYAKVHLHILIIGRNLQPVQVMGNEKDSLAKVGRSGDAFRAWRKLAKRHGFGWVVNVKAVYNGHRSASAYMSKYLSKENSNFRNSSGRLYRMYASSYNWSVDKSRYVPRFVYMGYHADHRANERAVTCDCAENSEDPIWLENQWLERVARLGFKDYFYRMMAQKYIPDFNYGMGLRIAPKIIWQKYHRRNRNGFESIPQFERRGH